MYVFITLLLRILLPARGTRKEWNTKRQKCPQNSHKFFYFKKKKRKINISPGNKNYILFHELKLYKFLQHSLLYSYQDPKTHLSSPKLISTVINFSTSCTLRFYSTHFIFTKCGIYIRLARFGKNPIMALYSYNQHFIKVNKNIRLERASHHKSSFLFIHLSVLIITLAGLLPYPELLNFPSKYYLLLSISYLSHSRLSFSPPVLFYVV